MPDNDSIAQDVEAGERLLPLAELRDEPFMPRPHGKKLDKSTAFRWAKRGLETVKSPGCMMTTRSAVMRFLSGGSKHGSAAERPRTPLRRSREIAAAERELAEAGI